MTAASLTCVFVTAFAEVDENGEMKRGGMKGGGREGGEGRGEERRRRRKSVAIKSCDYLVTNIQDVHSTVRRLQHSK